MLSRRKIFIQATALLPYGSLTASSDAYKWEPTMNVRLTVALAAAAMMLGGGIASAHDKDAKHQIHAHHVAHHKHVASKVSKKHVASKSTHKHTASKKSHKHVASKKTAKKSG
jgi:hypothetical protein